MNLDNDYLQDAAYRNLNAGAQLAGAAEGAETITQTTTQPAKTADVLSGQSVNVAVTSDFEKLLETLKLETEEQKRKLAIQQLSDVITRLTREVDNLGSADKKAIEDIAAANEKKAAAQSDISKFSELISLKTAELEQLTKNLREIQEKINERRNEEKRENATAIKNGTDAESVAELEAKAQELESAIVGVKAEIAVATAGIAAANVIIAQADAAIKTAQNSLSASALAIFEEAAKIVAAANSIDTDAKVEDPAAKKMREAAEKLVADMTEKLELDRKEDLQKALDAMIMKQIPAGELPDHEIKA